MLCWHTDAAREGVQLERRGNVDAGKYRAHLGTDKVGHSVVVALDDDVA